MDNPYLNALLAFSYIAVVVTFINSAEHRFFDSVPEIFSGMLMLSLLVFSVALMGFLFFFKPVQLCFEKQYQEATVFFVKTIAAFGIAVTLVLLSFFILVV